MKGKHSYIQASWQTARIEYSALGCFVKRKEFKQIIKYLKGLHLGLRLNLSVYVHKIKSYE